MGQIAGLRHGAFKSFCTVVRIKIQCKDPLAIPEEKDFELEKKFYNIGIVTELPDENGKTNDEPQDPPDHKPKR
jgi:hypothetical protein